MSIGVPWGCGSSWAPSEGGIAPLASWQLEPGYILPILIDGQTEAQGGNQVTPTSRELEGGEQKLRLDPG